MKIKKILTFLASLLAVSCTSNRQVSNEIEYVYGANEMYEKIWDKNLKVVHNESCVMIEDENGARSAQLLFKPKKIVCVRDCSLTKVYKPDEYYIKDNRIYMTEKSTMPYLTQANVNCQEIPDSIGGTYNSDKTESGKILFTEGPGIFLHQICVTYEKEGEWEGEIPLNYGNNLSNTYEKLENGEDLKIVYFGASTSTGANASSVFGMEPFQESFTDGFTNYLKRNYPDTNVESVNTSVGGWTSNDGRNNVVACAQQYNPDLVVMEFGHNDPFWNIKTDKYKENMQFIIDAVRSASPNCDFILITPQMPNKFSSQYCNHKDYQEICYELVDENDGIGICDWTMLTEELQKMGKSSFDMYANNINHPADWLERIFGSLLIQAFEK